LIQIKGFVDLVTFVLKSKIGPELTCNWKSSIELFGIIIIIIRGKTDGCLF